MMTLKPGLLTTAFLATAISTAMAQGAPAPKPAVPTPHADPGMITKPPAAVMHPPSTDPGMTVTPPHNGTAAVIPPPGTPGNNPTVVPK